jgi:predicted transcriptional regulator
MADLQSPRAALTVQLPADLVEELRAVASWKRVSIDEVVTEACLAYTEPRLWEQDYKEWLAAHPTSERREMGIDGEDLAPPRPEGQA